MFLIRYFMGLDPLITPSNLPWCRREDCIVSEGGGIIGHEYCTCTCNGELTSLADDRCQGDRGDADKDAYRRRDAEKLAKENAKAEDP
jgi:hypothetical protein